ncbi:MAG: helix-turn-helix transcriptional regulator, partial [Thermoleophilia bacterium]|nr:helix-turn-helix transcriptional regulator [Thermoleophilia bacterium]
KEKPRHGYEIMQELEQRTGGFYCPSPGTIYPTLQSLEDQDLIRSTQEDGKRVYSITDKGLAYLESREEEVKRHQGPWHALGPETLAEGWQAMSEARWFFGDVVRALRRTAADPAKLKEIREVLRETKKAIDDIVAR